MRSFHKRSMSCQNAMCYTPSLIHVYIHRVSPRPSIAPFDASSDSTACSPEKPIRKFNPKRLIRSRTMPAILTQPKASPGDTPRRHSHQHCHRGMNIKIRRIYFSPSSFALIHVSGHFSFFNVNLLFCFEQCSR